MGPVRAELMWQAVLDAAELVPRGADPASGEPASGDPASGEPASGEPGTPRSGTAHHGLDVLDLGGGTGSDAVRLASLGHRLTVVDPSPDALASLRRRAAEAGLGERVRGVLGDTADLDDHADAAVFDLVICHGVLEHVEDPPGAVAAMRRVLRPEGRLSLVVAGRFAAVLTRALAGEFAEAEALVGADAASWDLARQGPRRWSVPEVAELLASRGFVRERTQALRVFTDLVPSALVDVDPRSREALYSLERTVRSSAELAGFSGGLHTIARLDLASPHTDRGDDRATV